MIVKNAQKDLAACLLSARGVVDQIAIADTGSTDRTREIAEEFGATLVDFPWSDDFAAARNAALAPVTTDWVLVLDADEELEPGSAASIGRLLAASDGIGGYAVTIRNYVRDRSTFTLGRLSRVNRDDAERAMGAPSYVEHAMTRLFRRHPGICFSGRIHEAVDPQIAGLGLRHAHANFRIRHFGYLEQKQNQERKRGYYLELSHRKVAEAPDSALAWFELGTEYYQQENFTETLRCMETSYRLSPWPVALLFIGELYRRQQQLDKALAALSAIPLKSDPGLLASQMRGDILHELGRLGEARAAYRNALRLSPALRGPGEDRNPCGLEPVMESKLGYTEVRLGMTRTGLAKLRRAVAAAPEVIDNHDRLVKACVFLGRDAAAADAAEAVLKHFASEKIFARAASLRMRLGQRDRAEQILRIGLRVLPETSHLQAVLRQLETEEPARKIGEQIGEPAAQAV